MIGMATLTGEAGDNFCMRELGHDLGCSLCCCGHELYGVANAFQGVEGIFDGREEDDVDVLDSYIDLNEFSRSFKYLRLFAV